METYSDLLQFLKRPVYQKDDSTHLARRIGILSRLLMLSLVLSLVIGMLIATLEELIELELGEHAIDLLFEEYGNGQVVLVAILLAPVIEELIFRGPLFFFRKYRHFGWIYYLSTLVFAFYHITNFELNPLVWSLSPILVAPQLGIGLLLGYLRVKQGLISAMVLHALYNGVLIGPIVLARSLNIPWS